MGKETPQRNGENFRCCYRGNKENLQWIKKYYPNIKITTKLTRVLSDKSINSVIIATNISSHFNLAKKALLSGKNVFLEKPPTTSVSELNELIEIAKANKVLLFIDHIFVYYPIFFKVAQILKKEYPPQVRFKWLKWGTFDEDLLWNLAYHEVYLAINLFGTPISIKILEQNSIKTNLDLVKFKMDFKKRGRIIKCFFEINRHSPKKIKQIEFVLLKKKLIWEDDFLLQKNKMRKVLFKSKDKPLTLMCRKFIHKIENNDRSDPQEKVAKKAIGVIQRINQLAKR